jgi:hypothetical protein
VRSLILLLLLLMGSLVANLPEELGHLHHNAASLRAIVLDVPNLGTRKAIALTGRCFTLRPHPQWV